MIYTTIWISPRAGVANKCIFKGTLPFTPRVGESIVVRDDFCAETVKEVLWSVPDMDVLITLQGFDLQNEYGDCIFNKEWA